MCWRVQVRVCLVRPGRLFRGSRPTKGDALLLDPSCTALAEGEDFPDRAANAAIVGVVIAILGIATAINGVTTTVNGFTGTVVGSRAFRRCPAILAPFAKTHELPESLVPPCSIQYRWEYQDAHR
jgi:hypothetical protein